MNIFAVAPRTPKTGCTQPDWIPAARRSSQFARRSHCQLHRRCAGPPGRVLRRFRHLERRPPFERSHCRRCTSSTTLTTLASSSSSSFRLTLTDVRPPTSILPNDRFGPTDLPQRCPSLLPTTPLQLRRSVGESLCTTGI